MIDKPFSVAIMVTDPNKSAKWFEEKLGFDTSVKAHWVTAWPKGSQWKLHLCQGKLEPGNTGIAFYSQDVEKTAAEMKRKGVKFSMDATKRGPSTTAMFEDPDGNIFWLKQGEP
jgi:catechol 2,3-dioxygenase-like lactoylglutathione lyase family enzyme